MWIYILRTVSYFNGWKISHLKWIKVSARGIRHFSSLDITERRSKGICFLREDSYSKASKKYFIFAEALYILGCIHVNVKYRLRWRTRYKDLHRSTTDSFCATLCLCSAYNPLVLRVQVQKLPGCLLSQFFITPARLVRMYASLGVPRNLYIPLFALFSNYRYRPRRNAITLRRKSREFPVQLGCCIINP